MRLFAGGVAFELRQTAFEFSQAFLGAVLFGVERVARDDQPLQGGGGTGLGLAQRRHGFRRRLASFAGFGLGDGRVGDGADAQILGAVGIDDLSAFAPIQRM